MCQFLIVEDILEELCIPHVACGGWLDWSSVGVGECQFSFLDPCNVPVTYSGVDVLNFSWTENTSTFLIVLTLSASLPSSRLDGVFSCTLTRSTGRGVA